MSNSFQYKLGGGGGAYKRVCLDTNKAERCPSGSLIETFRFQDEDDCGYEIF